MKTLQMTLDDDLMEEVDRVVQQLHTTRSAFAREALRQAIERFNVGQLERQHRQGYEKHSVQNGEFSAWEDEQAWGDE